MPHKCTNCGDTFEDGSDDILSGCDCGSRKFEYISDEEAEQLEATESEPTVEEHAGETEPSQTTQETPSDPKDTLEDSIIIADDGQEDESQKRARSEVVSEDDLPSTPTSPTSLGEPTKDVEEVKQQLHEQFEGIRILEPGNYQINLMKLYQKQECVISLQEDGRYIINVPGMMESEMDEDNTENSDSD